MPNVIDSKLPAELTGGHEEDITETMSAWINFHIKG